MKALYVSRTTVRSLLALALVTLLAWPVAGQSQPSLAEIARKEAERRKSSKDAKAKKVITTKDLPESARKPASPPAAAEGGAVAPAAAGEQKPATTPADGASADQKGEAVWRQRITQAREALRRNEVFLEALQTRVNGLGFELANASDFNLRAKVSEDRQKGLAELERVKADVELSKKQIADIEEEARKAGVPPGWLR